ncbi:hypothetical protein BDP55DRAFT_662188 [Colletotrichum godetiae]|uniref:Uncharacterized protein n=1 Tax=Colletotrichum godetiae TaxID=1209918 RepID=A0AAJ0EWE4_9PEZI|nr:uncharacterized protein BDP55DRAFT_662188 [Colletotrichum godetiae]KAK1676283.1 hypothetical protein BDP55DRAFT_662188 [Colletotrichum godetiae]
MDLFSKPVLTSEYACTSKESAWCCCFEFCGGLIVFVLETPLSSVQTQHVKRIYMIVERLQLFPLP